MRDLVPTPRFERAFQRLVRKHPPLQPQIEEALRRMATDITDPRLKTHHLSGRLAGLHASSAGYDCRIVFAKDQHPQTGAEVLILVDIGSQDEVY